MFGDGAVLRLSQYVAPEVEHEGEEILEVDGIIVREIRPPWPAENWVLAVGIIVVTVLALLTSALSSHSHHPSPLPNAEPRKSSP